MTDIAGDIDIRQKMHLYFYDPVSTTGFTPSPFNVKTKSPGLIPSYSRFGRSGKKFSDIRKNTGICSGVGTRGSADGRLIDMDDFIDMSDALYFLE